MEQLLIISHIVCGASVLAIGLIQMAGRKGTQKHVLLGRAYVGAMWWICFSAFAIIVFYRFSAFLLVIGILTFYASFTGVRVLHRREVGTEKWYDWAVALITSCFGLGLMGYGINLFLRHPGNEILASLCLFFGFFTLFNAMRDVIFFVKKQTHSELWWLRQHIGAMGGSYIAAVTAFAVQNPNLFMPGSNYQWLLWILPTAIGNPIIVYAIRKRMKKEVVPAGK